MKSWCLIGMWMLATFLAVAQKQDTVKTIKDAPESLQKMVEKMASQKEKKNNDVELEIDGLVIDATRTKSGKEFYNLFYNQWSAPSHARNYSIFIIEKPFRLINTLIEIKINETTVYRALLQPRTAYIEQIARQAVEQTAFYLANYEEIMRQLEGEDQSGSGIY